MDLRQASADSVDHDSLHVCVSGNAVQVTLPGRDKPSPLLPLGSAQFVQASLYNCLFEFHRDARGKVRGVTVSMPEAGSVTYYRRD